MSKSIVLLLGIIPAVALLLPSRARSAATPTPVLVELFTSEGCSSCPPADRLLRAIEAETTPGADVIVMSEHVDYWDYLGWRDPFSSAQLTRRQQDYGRVFRNNGIYTPQMVVNGRAEFVGNDGSLAGREIKKAIGRPTATVRLGAVTIAPGDKGKSVATVQLTVGELPPTSASDEFEVLVAITETGLRSKPRNGENAGTALEHTGVVRSLIKAGRIEAGKFESTIRLNLDSSWDKDALRVVAFVQEKKSRVIWGVAQRVMEPAGH